MAFSTCKVGDLVSITEICSTHNKQCTKIYEVIVVGPRLKLRDNESECIFMGQHYCSSQMEPMTNPYLTCYLGRYGLESEDYETHLDLDDVKIL